MDLGIDLSGIPDATDEQDERVTVLILRRAAGGADAPPDAVTALQAVVDVVEASGYDPEQSYIATRGLDRDLGGAAPLLDVLASVQSV